MNDAEEQTDYLLVRFQGNNNLPFHVSVKEALIKMVEEHGDEVGVAFITVSQKRSRYVPAGAWDKVRHLFDILLNWSKK